jgi:hypothetical protein
MTAKKLKDVLQRVEAWPEAAQARRELGWTPKHLDPEHETASE